ncbi:MAG: Ig-like domain-containing protein [Chloroflexota bacterium]
MTTRRDHRQTHVRPRPPSNGRPAPVKVKPRSPGPVRLSGHQPIRRSSGMPLIFRLGLLAAVLALSAGVLFVGLKGFGGIVGGIGSTFGGFVAGVTSTPSPRPIVPIVADAPSLEQPTEPYTAESTVDLVVTVPAALIGDTGHRIKIYLQLPDQPPTAIQESPIAETPKTIIPVTLEKGINDFSVSITGPGGESEHSAVVRYVLDTVPPKITVTSPKQNAVVNGKAVKIQGKTQARTTLLARNDASGSSIAGTAETDGTFTLSLALAPGVNQITIVGTDPAGNVTEASLTVKRGSGKLTVALTSSTYQIKRSRLPEPVTLYATVTDPDGRAIAGASVTFTLSMPGIPTVTIDGRTDANGKASFQTTIPKGATVGQGSATVLVTTQEFGPASDSTPISIVR